jgi:hypothetical protein
MGFTLIPMLGLISPLIALPAITATHGASAWVAVAVGQSLGLTASVLIELGWALNGPQRVARASDAAGRRYLILSIATKCSVLVPTAILATLLAFSLTHEHRVEAMMVAFASALTGLSPTWYFIGVGSPAGALISESGPRVIFMVVSATMIGLGGPLWLFPVIGLGVPALAAPVLAILLTRASVKSLARWTFRRILSIVWLQRLALSGRAVSAFYISLPTALVGIVSPSSVGTFAAADRLMRMGLAVLSSVPNSLQRYVGVPATVNGRLRRAERAIVGNVALGLVAGLTFAALAPAVSSFIFSGVVSVSGDLAWASCVVILVVCTSRATGNLALVSARRIEAITRSAVAGALVGVPGVLVLAAHFGVIGGMLGALAAESTVLLVQLLALRRKSHSRQ